MLKYAADSQGARLSALIEALKLRKKDFAESVGVTPGYVSELLGGQRIGRTLLIAICCVHKVNRPWLERGEGAMFAGGEAPAGEFSAVPVVAVRLAAGEGAEVQREGVLDHLQFKTAWLRGELRTGVRNLVAMHVEGESMEPSLSDGDVVLVDRAHTDPTREGLYALRQDNALLIKRTRVEGERVLLISDNPAYAPVVFPWPAPIHRAQVIGRVVWAGKRL